MLTLKLSANPSEGIVVWILLVLIVATETMGDFIPQDVRRMCLGWDPTIAFGAL